MTMIRQVGMLFGSALRFIFVSVIVVSIVGVGWAVATNFTATQGSGTTFASKVISAVNYVQILICDATAGTTQCAAVNGSGNLSTLDANSAAILTGVTAAVPAGTNYIGQVGVTSGPTVATTLVWGTTAAMTSTTSTQVIALVASNRIYVTHIDCNNTSTSVNTLVTVQDGSGGTTLATLSAADNYGGQASTAGFGSALFATTSGNGLYAKNVTTGASVICNASGYSGS